MDSEVEVACVSCHAPSRQELCSHCEEMKTLGLLEAFIAGEIECVGCSDEHTEYDCNCAVCMAIPERNR